MSYTRHIGYLISKAIQSAPEKKEALCAALEISKTDFEKLCAGRLLLAPSELERTADILEIDPEQLLDEDAVCDYQDVVHCMSQFTDRKNLDLIRDLIDAYIDAKEVLCTQ